MPNFAANLSLMFTEWSFLDRFAAAADAGFTAVEFLFPYEEKPEAIGERLRGNGLVAVLFNMPPGDWHNGERGLASLPSRRAEFDDGVGRALDYAAATGVGRLHMMAGRSDPADRDAGLAFRGAAAHAAERLAERGLDLLLEPINGRDMPGYFLRDFDRAGAIIEELGEPNLKLQFDLYHCQIIHGDVTARLRRMLPMIGHVQVASVPSRHEPDGEELNCPHLFAELDRLGYAGHVGCEYRPRAGTLEGLGWFAPHAAARRAGP